jgi:hypothetical protein
LGLCGISSAASLILATRLGDALRDDYDPIRHTISELYQAGAPHAYGLMILFTAYHFLVIPFAAGLHRGLPAAPYGFIGPLLLALAGLLGIPLGSYARCDPGCFGATTFQGRLHGILVLITVPLIFGAMFAIWQRLRRHERWSGVARYTLVSLTAGVVFGIAIIPFVQGPYAGLLERVSVVLILQWYVVMGIRLVVGSAHQG